MPASKDLEKKYKVYIVGLSILIPLVVMVLFTVKLEGYDFSILPHIYAPINGLTAIVLILAVLAVKNGNIDRHSGLMKLAMGMSLLFLLLYILYHMTSDPTLYGDINKDGKLDAEESSIYTTSRLVYFLILISHIILSVSVIPLVLISFVRGYFGKIEEHKKIVKYTFPIWLYVAISGVVVYLMILPFYH